ncbi:MAG TPA: ammonia-forming cytochrome c nitrite reductase subunit c552 [Longimicrobium sp.]|nr:ammonia-forming cytochrome c nitrite reductase subunit c552 [Longimicrobium sp.]
MTDPTAPAPAPEPRPARRRWSTRWLIGATVAAAVVTLGLAALLTNIFQRQQEARNPFYRVVELNDTITDPAVWGKNFPLQYDSYLRTVDMVRTRYGGSEAVPRNPTANDPRDTTAQSRLEEDPRLRQLWAGYAFARDFREERGHAYVLADQLYTERQQATNQPGACLHCHASMYVPYLRAGNGDLMAGFARLNPLPYAEAKRVSGANHPVACIDCHDSETMQLRVTRPGFIEGIRALKASQGVPNYDVNRQATRQEMRTYVCGQCHVEYYFRGPEKRLTYPWERGLAADSILAYYEANGHKDWVHQVSGAPVLKAQHPEFELYNQGIHARSGVACADCHMPYQRVGATKISDHHVRSPLLNINRACQTCHHFSEDELRERVHTIQDRTFQMRNIALDAVLDLTRNIAAAQRGGTPPARLEAARRQQRRAQFLVDFIEAENSMGFHADQEAARVLAMSINESRLGEAALRGVGATVTRSPVRPAQLVTPREGGEGQERGGSGSR